VMQESKQVLEARVAYVRTDMMEGVINSGLGVSAVRGRGFAAPAAGKTGSSHDGWFAGYTSNILCIVWVGYDDYSDLHLSGAQTAAPIWTEFMKKAAALPQYADMRSFSQPSGVVDVQLDKDTKRLATSYVQETDTAPFGAGTEPRETWNQTAGVGGFFSHLLGLGDKPLPPPPAGVQATPENQAAQDAEKKKKGFFGKIVGIFKEDKSAPQPSKPADAGSEPH